MSPLLSKRSFFLALVVCLATGALCTAQDPFVGEWKFNPAKGQLIDVMKVESLGGNKITLDFGGGPEKIVADGTDQPSIYGTVLSVKVAAPDNWIVVRKKDGRKLLTGLWKLSQDGNTLNDNYTEYGENGSPATVDYLYKRTAAGQGFAGTWEATMPMNPAFVMQVRPYEGSGLAFVRSEKDIRNLKLDGKDYPDTDDRAAEGSTSSSRRVNESTLEVTERVKDKITKTERIELSADHKTLTRTVHPAGQRDPNIFVYERQ